jgi:hypothetical protein
MNGEVTESDIFFQKVNTEIKKLSLDLEKSETIKKNFSQLLIDKGRLLHLEKERISEKKGDLLQYQENSLNPLNYLKNRQKKKETEEYLHLIQGQIYAIEDEISKLKQQECTILDKIEKLKKELWIKQDELSFTLSQREKGLELFDGNWVEKAEIPRLKEIRVGLTSNFSTMSGFDFEYFVARLLRAMGFETEVTKKTGDYGVDIIAKKDRKIVAVQCKRYTEGNPVGNGEIQKCLGAMHKVKAKNSIFVTTSHFTKNALQQAEKAPIELWDKDTLHNYVKKYLLSHNINEILGPIELELERERKLKELQEQEEALLREKKLTDRLERKRKAEERREIERQKAICPRCHHGKMKTRKYCSKCTEEVRKEQRRKHRRRRSSFW